MQHCAAAGMDRLHSSMAGAAGHTLRIPLEPRRHDSLKYEPEPIFTILPSARSSSRRDLKKFRWRGRRRFRQGSANCRWLRQGPVVVRRVNRPCRGKRSLPPFTKAPAHSPSFSASGSEAAKAAATVDHHKDDVVSVRFRSTAEIVSSLCCLWIAPGHHPDQHEL